MQPRHPGTVYLVDDEDVVRDALAWLLRSRRLLLRRLRERRCLRGLAGTE
jgi:FixJ family two-component response regulator